MTNQEKELLMEILKPSNKKINKKVIELLDKLKVSSKSYIDKDYIFLLRKPELPILVAHMDIAHNRPNLKDKDIVANNWYIWSPLGIGGDDRCGIFALLVLSNLEVNLLFTHWEERGGIGASKFIESKIAKEIDPCYLIEFDRRGKGEWVCYNYDDMNTEWNKKLNRYFTLGIGSFSDITILGKYWGICSANLSIGFYNEHSISEYIELEAIEDTIRKIPDLLKDLGCKKYMLPEKIDYGYRKIDRWINLWGYPEKRKGKKKYKVWIYEDYEEIERLYDDYEDYGEIESFYYSLNTDDEEV